MATKGSGSYSIDQSRVRTLQGIPYYDRAVARDPTFALALANHLVHEAWNSYVVDPFWPVDNGWFYGDAINIVEPFFWLFMGVAVMMNARSPRTRGDSRDAP